ncbi:MAG: hypothetical protein IKM31_04985 [Oscillospiraceae bacterium]|nr:hypothetical protein [Oscillospiraceae bacterium]
MKLGIIGSYDLVPSDLRLHLPDTIGEILSDGVGGLGDSLRQYALAKGIKMTEYFPEYDKYGPKAVRIRDRQLIGEADRVIVFHGRVLTRTDSVEEICRELGKPMQVIRLDTESYL